MNPSVVYFYRGCDVGVLALVSRLLFHVERCLGAKLNMQIWPPIRDTLPNIDALLVESGGMCKLRDPWVSKKWVSLKLYNTFHVVNAA